jgi:hypothetical protein
LSGRRIVEAGVQIHKRGFGIGVSVGVLQRGARASRVRGDLAICVVSVDLRLPTTSSVLVRSVPGNRAGIVADCETSGPWLATRAIT